MSLCSESLLPMKEVTQNVNKLKIQKSSETMSATSAASYTHYYDLKFTQSQSQKTEGIRDKNTSS